MRPSIAIVMACLVTVTVNGQYGQGGFFSFNRGPFYQPTGAFRPPFRAPFHPPPFAHPGFGAGGCVPYPNYQYGGRSFWVSWRGIYNQFVCVYGVSKKLLNVVFFGHHTNHNRDYKNDNYLHNLFEFLSRARETTILGV
jgi:hypothetical protein